MEVEKKQKSLSLWADTLQYEKKKLKKYSLPQSVCTKTKVIGVVVVKGVP